MKAMIQRFGRKITVERIGSGEYDENGIWSPGKKETFQITASVQDLGVDEMLKLPENQRDRHGIKVFTTEEINVVSVGEKKNANVLIVDGKRYEVFRLADFFLPGCMNIRYYRADALSENEVI